MSLPREAKQFPVEHSHDTPTFTAKELEPIGTKPPRRKPSGPTPNARSAKLMRERGYKLVAPVEQTIPHTFIKRDLFGIGDILAVRDDPPDIAIVQATSDNGGNVAKRVDKITNHEATPILRKAGFTILVHGWRRQIGGHDWRCREIDLS